MNSMIKSKVTSKFQATIPAEIRKTLGLRGGDTVAFEVIKGEVRLRRATPLDIAYAQALKPTLSEWESDNDNKAYRDL